MFCCVMFEFGVEGLALIGLDNGGVSDARFQSTTPVAPTAPISKTARGASRTRPGRARLLPIKCGVRESTATD